MWTRAEAAHRAPTVPGYEWNQHPKTLLVVVPEGNCGCGIAPMSVIREAFDRGISVMVASTAPNDNTRQLGKMQRGLQRVFMAEHLPRNFLERFAPKDKVGLICVQNGRIIYSVTGRILDPVSRQAPKGGHMNTSESARNKWIAGGAVLVVLLAGGSMMRLRSLQQQASPSNPQAQAAAINARLALTPEEQARRLKLVTHLRETWKPWAEKHQGELRRMLSASASDSVARDAVWNNIPASPSVNKEFVKALNSGGNGAKGEVFSWYAMSKGMKPSQVSVMPADEKSGYDQEQSAVKWALQNDFASHRDIIISDSVQTGDVSVSLWASGRVTEDTIRKSRLRTPEGYGASTYNRKEILPPYDFLTSKKGTSS